MYFGACSCSDALILNTDRHLGNFGFLFDNQTMEVKTAAPIFDHNRSLLFDLDEDQLAKPEWYIGNVPSAYRRGLHQDGKGEW